MSEENKRLLREQNPNPPLIPFEYAISEPKFFYPHPFPSAPPQRYLEERQQNKDFITDWSEFVSFQEEGKKIQSKQSIMEMIDELGEDIKVKTESYVEKQSEEIIVWCYEIIKLINIEISKNMDKRFLGKIEVIIPKDRYSEGIDMSYLNFLIDLMGEYSVGDVYTFNIEISIDGEIIKSRQLRGRLDMERDLVIIVNFYDIIENMSVEYLNKFHRIRNQKRISEKNKKREEEASLKEAVRLEREECQRRMLQISQSKVQGKIRKK